MKKLSILAFALGALMLASCGGDDNGGGGNNDLNVVTENISGDVTWTNDKVWILGGRITVLSGATLTIEPGTIIKGQAGAEANSTVLLVARGGTLIAEGTADAPIIFTSVADEITPEQVAEGNFASPNLSPTINGLWGGVIVLGNARISASNEGAQLNQVQIEGIPTSDPNGLYGGTDDEDNSGILKYVSIRHGGTLIGSGNEINGLTLGGVGSGTTIDHIEVVANQDDGIEWFGGTVDVTNVVVWNVGDDAIDTDQAWAGSLDNYVVVTPTGHCFELDGPEGTYGEVDGVATIQHTLSNGTVLASDEDRTSSDLINTDSDSGVIFENLFITGIAEGQVINRVNAGGVSFSGVVLNVPAENLADYLPAGTELPFDGISAGTTGTKANASVFGWTWASQNGALTGL